MVSFGGIHVRFISNTLDYSLPSSSKSFQAQNMQEQKAGIPMFKKSPGCVCSKIRNQEMSLFLQRTWESPPWGSSNGSKGPFPLHISIELTCLGDSFFEYGLDYISLRASKGNERNRCHVGGYPNFEAAPVFPKSKEH